MELQSLFANDARCYRTVLVARDQKPYIARHLPTNCTAAKRSIRSMDRWFRPGKTAGDLGERFRCQLEQVSAFPPTTDPCWIALVSNGTTLHLKVLALQLYAGHGLNGKSRTTYRPRSSRKGR